MSAAIATVGAVGLIIGPSLAANAQNWNYGYHYCQAPTPYNRVAAKAASSSDWGYNISNTVRVGTSVYSRYWLTSDSAVMKWRYWYTKAPWVDQASVQAEVIVSANLLCVAP